MAKLPPTPEPPLPPDPPIQRIRSQEFRCGEFVERGFTLLCPRCGEPTLRYLGVCTFERARDGFSTAFVRVEDSIVQQSRQPILPVDRATASTQRHHGVNVEFGCASCISVYDDKALPKTLGYGLWLELVESNSICVLQWCYDPLPEDYQAHEPATPLPPPGG